MNKVWSRPLIILVSFSLFFNNLGRANAQAVKRFVVEPHLSSQKPLVYNNGLKNTNVKKKSEIEDAIEDTISEIIVHIGKFGNGLHHWCVVTTNSIIRSTGVDHLSLSFSKHLVLPIKIKHKFYQIALIARPNTNIKNSEDDNEKRKVERPSSSTNINNSSKEPNNEQDENYRYPVTFHIVYEYENNVSKDSDENLRYFSRPARRRRDQQLKAVKIIVSTTATTITMAIVTAPEPLLKQTKLLIRGQDEN